MNYSLEGIFRGGGHQTSWQDDERVFCRGWRLGDDGTRNRVLVVVPAADEVPRSIVDRLAHEYGLKDELDRTWAARPIELVRDAGRTVLILEDAGGEPLERLLDGPMEMGIFLRLAIGAAAAIGKVHRRGLVHKDVKPANLLVNDQTGEIRLTGFGIASRIAGERQTPQSAERIAGTLAYMSPEQTGCMNRSIDGRSDLYSLGVTLYRMLTGSLPFTAAEPIEWIHCHIARPPLALRERAANVPAPLSAIVMKLLSKTSEERYQTAAGLERDLRRCLENWEAERRIDDFPLAEHDLPDRLLIPETLYGRTRDVATLVAAFDRIVRGGGPELVLVSGYSGIGKSSVVNELHKALVPSRALFAAGKFDQYKRDIPYSTVAQAFQGLIRVLLAKGEDELSRWGNALRDALGPNGQLIVDLVPDLKVVIGEPPPVPALPPQDAQRRFQLVFRRFLEVFAQPEHPLVLFLDDLQWLDTATLDLLEDLMTRGNVAHLLLIGAYRDNEVTSSHPLVRTLDRIRSAVAVQDVVLAPLSHEHVGQLIADSLHCDEEPAAALAELLHQKTAGNPFFVVQFLAALAEEDLLHFDHDAARWSWDLARIRSKGYADNVVDLMVGKLSRLPIATLRFLQLLACLGNGAELARLSMVREGTDEELHDDLREALRTGVVLHSDGSYRFLHDRVQEAAYSLIPEGRRPEAHLRIGRLLAEHVPSEARDEAIFEIVNQLNRGLQLITERDEREQIAELNLAAGKRAKDSSAYESALAYFAAGAALLPEDAWERRQELVFELELHRSDCEVYAGELRTAEQRLLALTTRCVGTVQRCAVAHRQLDLYVALGVGERAVAVALDCLRHVGIDWSAHPSEADARREYERIWSLLGDRTIEDLVDLPLIQDPEARATLDVLTSLVLPALYTDKNLYALCACMAVNLSLVHGNCEASPLNYAATALIAGPRFGHYDEGYRFGRMACALLERRGLTHFGARSYVGFAIVVPWTRPLKEGIEPSRRAFQMAKDHADPTYAALAARGLVSILLALGHPLDRVEAEAQDASEFLQRYGFFLDRLSASIALARSLRGRTAKFGSLDDQGFTERSFEERITGQPSRAFLECFYWLRKLQARFLAGDDVSAIEATERIEAWYAMSPALSLFPLEKAEAHFFSGLCRAARCEPLGPDAYAVHREALRVHEQQLRAMAANCPQNFEDRAALLGAEIARVEGRPLDAMDLYERAIMAARANGFVQNEAIACELAARFHAARGFQEIADLYLRNSRRAYLRWGADEKVRQLDRRYPRGHDALVADSSSLIAAPLEHLDLATVLKVSQAISGEMVVEKLLDTLMRTAVEHAGAKRALLILLRRREPRIVAEATTEADSVTVRLCEEPIGGSLPESVLRYVLRTRDNVILDDAAAPNPFSTDPYIGRAKARSVFCLPLMNQAKLVGALYLENDLSPGVFAPARTAVLRLLASQAAISLENTRLYSDLAERESRIRRLVEANVIGIFIWGLDGKILEANDAFLSILGYDREDLVAGRLDWTAMTPPEWRERDSQLILELAKGGTLQPFEKEYFRKDGSRVPVLIGVASFEGDGDQGVAFVLDLTERKRAERSALAQHRATRILAEALTLEEAMPRILGALCECLDWDVATWWRLDQDSDVLRCAELWTARSLEAPEFEAATRARHFTRGSGLVGRAWASRAPVCFPDVALEPTFLRASVAAREGLRAAFAFPLLLGGEVLGVIDLVSREVRHPHRDLLDMMADLGSQIGHFIERRRAEHSLRESEHESRLIVNTIPGLVAMLAPGGEVQEVNDQLIDYCGQPLEAMREWGTNGTVHVDDLPHVGRAFGLAIASGEPYEFEARIRRFDGVYRWFQIRGLPLRDTSGQVARWYCLLTDIEERKRADAELRQAYASFVDAQHLSKTGSFITDLVGDDHKWSDQAYRIFDFDPATKVSVQRIRDIIHPDDLASFESVIARGMTGEDVNFAFRIVPPGAGVKHVRGVARVTGQNEGHPLFIGALQDVTERVVAEEALEEARSELAHVTRVTTMGELTASIAHEVRQPIAAAVTSAQTALRWLEAQPPDLGEVRDALSRVVRAGKSAGAVVGRIRALVTKAAPRRDAVDVNAAIREVVELTRGEAVRNRVAVRVGLADGLPAVEGDRVQLQQVILNLIINGIEAMSGDGEVSRELRIVSRRENPGVVRVAVADTGPGLSPEASEQMFSAFYTTKPGGLGLGLSICRSIIEAHEGRLWATANEPRGAVFQFTLPIPAR